jgi:hypothetical protein
VKIRPTPPEGTDGAQQCVSALDRAVEAVAVAYESDEREHWESAIEAIGDARFWALWHAGQLFARFARIQAAQGIFPCSSCHRFLPREALVEKVINYGVGEKGKQSHWRQCHECLEKQGNG